MKSARLASPVHPERRREAAESKGQNAPGALMETWRSEPDQDIRRALTLRLRFATLRVNGGRVFQLGMLALALLTFGCAHAPARTAAAVKPSAPVATPPPPPVTLPQSLALAQTAPDQARVDLERLAAAHDTAELEIDLAVLAERAGDPAGARGHYERALAIAPKNAAAWDDLVRLLARGDQAAEAVARARASKGAAQDALALALLLDGQGDAAAAEAKARLHADERDVRAMQVLAEVYLRAGKNELARMVLENARALAPKDPRIAEALGRAQLALGDRASALELFQKAAALAPDFPEAHANYGALLCETEDYDAAVHELELAVRLAPDLLAAKIGLGNAYRAQGKAAEALAQYQAALAIAPKDLDATFDLALLHLDAKLPDLDTTARLQRAIALFEQFEKLGGRDPQLDDDLAQARRDLAREQHRLEREKQRALRVDTPQGQPAPKP